MDLSTPTHPLLAEISQKPSIPETLGFQLNGLIVVLLALTMIWGIMEVIGLFFRTQAANNRPVPVATPLAQPSALRPPDNNSIPPEVLVAICAAVGFAFSKKTYRIHEITPAASDWAREGRRQIFASHVIR